MISCGRRGACTRRKAKKKRNRYNPNWPSYAAVHRNKLLGGSILGALTNRPIPTR